jgi:hypothetical protein
MFKYFIYCLIFLLTAKINSTDLKESCEQFKVEI